MSPLLRVIFAVGSLLSFVMFFVVPFRRTGETTLWGHLTQGHGDFTGNPLGLLVLPLLFGPILLAAFMPLVTGAELLTWQLPLQGWRRRLMVTHAVVGGLGALLTWFVMTMAGASFGFGGSNGESEPLGYWLIPAFEIVFVIITFVLARSAS